MSGTVKIDLYGPRNRRIKSSQLSKAKGLHIYVKKSARSKLKRVTDDIIKIPALFKSVFDKEYFINALVDQLKIEYGFEEVQQVDEIKEFQKEKRVSITKPQFQKQLRRIIFDELMGNKKSKDWPSSRVENLIEALWTTLGKNGRTHALNEDFRRQLASAAIHKEDTNIEKYGQRPGEEDQKKFTKLLSRKSKGDDSTVPVDVKLQFKEVFNFSNFNDKKSDKEFHPVYNKFKAEIQDVPRQMFFSQVIGEFKKQIVLSLNDLKKESIHWESTRERLKEEIKKVFKESNEAGLFPYEEVPSYIIRLVSPMIDANGNVKNEYRDQNGHKTSGHGFSNGRTSIKNEKELDKAIDRLMMDYANIMSRYILLNSMAGVAIDRFVIERRVK